MKRKRFMPLAQCQLQVRETQDGQDGRVVEGCAIVFGRRSNNLTPWSDRRVVYEVLEPGCLSSELLQRSDVIYNLNHNSNVTNVLGRHRGNSNDTLLLDLRADGLYTRCDLPHTNAANDTLELIRRGDISGQSFAFEDDWEDSEYGVSYERTGEVEDGKEVWVRHVKKITALYDVSIVTHPAYEQTNVGAREAQDQIDKAIEAQLEREQNTAVEAEDEDPAAVASLEGQSAEAKEDEQEREEEDCTQQCLMRRARLESDMDILLLTL